MSGRVDTRAIFLGVDLNDPWLHNRPRDEIATAIRMKSELKYLRIYRAQTIDDFEFFMINSLPESLYGSLGMNVNTPLFTRYFRVIE